MFKVKRAKTCAPSGCFTLTIVFTSIGLEIGIVKG